MLAFKIISLLSHSEGNKIFLKSAVFLQSSSGSCLHPSTLYELESCLKSMKKGILFSFFFTIVESYLTSLKIFENLPRFEKNPKLYVRCIKPQIPRDLFISKLRNQSIWWLPERGQCAFMLVASNTVSHCLQNNFLSRNCFDWALGSNRLLPLNAVLFITINPVADREPLPFGNPLGFIAFCEASKLSCFYRYLTKNPITSAIQKAITGVSILDTSLGWYISAFIIYLSDQILLAFMYFWN